MAVGTITGDLLLIRDDGAILPLAYDLGSALTTLAFNDVGTILAFGSDFGAYGLVTLQDLA